MKRPHLMVAKIIRKRPRVKKPIESKSVKYFNSLQNRTPKLSSPLASVYELWTTNIRQSMQEKKIWPIGTEEWTYVLVMEYVKRLQSEFWKSSRVDQDLILKLNFSKKVDYLAERYELLYPLLKVFNIIFYSKLKRHTAKWKICRLPIQRWYISPLYTYTHKYEMNRCQEKVSVEARFEKFY
ncbi:MAG: hypothetical protein V4686_01190 [Patescibacteria group bacterium]